jgi:hypothetical protein
MGKRKGKQKPKSNPPVEPTSPRSQFKISRRKVIQGLVIMAAVSQVSGVTLKDLVKMIPSPTPAPTNVAITPGTGSLSISVYDPVRTVAMVATTSTTNATPNHTNSCFSCEPVERLLLDYGTPNS